MVWSAADPTVQLGYKGHAEEGAMELFTLGIDLGKTTFHLVGMNQRGEVVGQRKVGQTEITLKKRLGVSSNRPFSIRVISVCPTFRLLFVLLFELSERNGAGFVPSISERGTV
jgi:hypothetical protein